jgi:hypothetical protein
MPANGPVPFSDTAVARLLRCTIGMALRACIDEAARTNALLGAIVSQCREFQAVVSFLSPTSSVPRFCVLELLLYRVVDGKKTVYVPETRQQNTNVYFDRDQPFYSNTETLQPHRRHAVCSLCSPSPTRVRRRHHRTVHPHGAAVPTRPLDPNLADSSSTGTAEAATHAVSPSHPLSAAVASRSNFAIKTTLLISLT